jgi:HPr kinase/phosphorylase
MQIHGSCISRDGAGVLLLGPSGCGKSDLALRLLECGFVLVADDRVELDGMNASAPALLAGLLEVRGLGIIRLPYTVTTKLALVADLSARAERLPIPQFHPNLGLPMVQIDAAAASAPLRIARALDCALGRTEQIAGSFRA